MRKPKGFRNHTAAPRDWRHTANLTGDYEMDASIASCRNKSVPGKLKTHLLSEEPYGPRSNYSGYRGYSGDD